MSVVFTGSAQTPCSASVSGPGLNAPLTPAYTSNVNAGMATAIATYGGGGNYVGSNGSAMFQITGAPTNASISCPASWTYTGSPVTPCSGGVTGPGLSQSVTPTYVNNVVGLATATINFTAGGNYLASTASTTFRTLYVQSGCFASPVRSVMPPTSTSVSKSSTVKVNCALLTANATGVTNATGSLVVQDKGTNGLGTPITVLSVANAFSASPGGSYSYSLNTSSAAFVSRHYYFLTATWSDGSTTTGWLYIKSSHDDD